MVAAEDDPRLEWRPDRSSVRGRSVVYGDCKHTPAQTRERTEANSRGAAVASFPARLEQHIQERMVDSAREGW